MRVLFVHSDRVSFEVSTEAAEDAEDVGSGERAEDVGAGEDPAGSGSGNGARDTGSDEKSERDGVPPSGRLTDCVTAFVAVETVDETDVDATVAAATTELGGLADRLNTDRIALYPSPLLSDDPADATAAATVLRRVEAALDDEYDVLRAPSGWHASFEVSCKGHPLSTGVRTVDPTRDGGRDPTASEWTLLTSDGEHRDPAAAKTDFDAAMRRVVTAEVPGERPSDGNDEGQAYAETLAEAGLASEASPGPGRSWLPRGTLVRDCLTAYADDLVRAFGALPVETPRAYDLDADAVRAHAAAFGASGGRADIGGRRALLRPAHDLGHCSLLATADLDAADLPVRLYESGDVWTEPTTDTRGSDVVPEMHTAVADASEAREEFRRQAALVRDANAALETDAAPVLRVSEAFREAHEDWIETLAADGDGPVLVEKVTERIGCWAARLDLVATDARGRTVETGTVRLDEETVARFGVEYADGSRTPTLLRCSPTGALDDALRAVLADPERERAGLPTWLAPTQVRLIPVDEDHVETCDDAVEDLTDAGVRADVDDRDGSVGDRIDRADDERVPHYAVVGDREREGETLPVTDRVTGRERAMGVDELAATVREATDGFPSLERYWPRHLGGTPEFGG